MTPRAAYDCIEVFASQFHGFSLDYRRHGTDWPGPWRAMSMYTKNERAHLRTTCYGDTPEQAIEELAVAVDTLVRNGMLKLPEVAK